MIYGTLILAARWRQGPVSIQDYKERDCSHGSVAFTHGNLDSPATGPRTGTERTPNSPRSLHGCGIMLFGYTQAVFAVLQWQRNREGSGRINEGSVKRSREREWGDWVKEKVKEEEELTEWAHEILSMELATHLSALSCFDANLGEITQWGKWKNEEPEKTFHGWVWLDTRQENVTHTINKYISAHNRRIIWHRLINRLQFTCLVWRTLAWHGMRGWCKHEKVSTCVYLCVSAQLSCSSSLSGRKRGLGEKVLIKS